MDMAVRAQWSMQFACRDPWRCCGEACARGMTVRDVSCTMATVLATSGSNMPGVYPVDHSVANLRRWEQVLRLGTAMPTVALQPV